MRIRNFKKKKFKPNKKVLTAGFIGFCVALALWIGFASPGQYLYTSSQAGYDNTNSGMNSDNVQDALDELYECAVAKNAADVTLSVGDYVEMTPTLSSYTTEPKYTGYSTTQTINPQELNLWRVIRVNSDGTYDAVSDKVSSVNITFQGKIGYQSYSYYLNVLASKYENTKFTVDSRYMGYTGQTLFITDTSYFDGTDTKAGTSWQQSTPNDGINANEYLGNGEWFYNKEDRGLVNAVYGDLIAYKAGTSTATRYFLASRYYHWNSSTDFGFLYRFVREDGVVDSSYLIRYNSGWTENSRIAALRPIITLRSGLKATGSGTSADPYVLR